MKTEAFGSTSKGVKATLYTLKNSNNTTVKVTDFGATLVSILFADKNGKQRDLILGYDDVKGYEDHTTFFGAAVGRNGNRIKDGKFSINGKEYQLEQNENENNLHSGSNGFHNRLWEVKDSGDNFITFHHFSPEAEQGFPGDMDITIKYTLDDEDTLHLEYNAKANKDTIMNFTNHTYYNLGGHDSGVIYDQKLQLMSDIYNPVIDSKSIPTGENAPVSGTPMDFTKAKAIGQDIEADFEQLKFTKGFDHNYVLCDKPGTMRTMAIATCDESGIGMEASTDCVAVQFYAGNFIGEQTGKNGVKYGDRHGFCLESQYCPNAINDEHFVSPVIPANTEYHSETKYHFYHI